MSAHAASELQVSQWFNQDQPLSLAQLRGKVVVLHAFQMLCPGCVSHGVPQAERLHWPSFCSSIASAIRWRWTR